MEVLRPFGAAKASQFFFTADEGASIFYFSSPRLAPFGGADGAPKASLPGRVRETPPEAVVSRLYIYIYVKAAIH